MWSRPETDILVSDRGSVNRYYSRHHDGTPPAATAGWQAPSTFCLSEKLPPYLLFQTCLDAKKKKRGQRKSGVFTRRIHRIGLNRASKDFYTSKSVYRSWGGRVQMWKKKKSCRQPFGAPESAAQSLTNCHLRQCWSGLNAASLNIL